MKHRLSTTLLALALGALTIGGCAQTAAQAPTADSAEATTQAPKPTAQGAQVPNPAAVFCQEQGYEYQIRTAGDGSQYGVCVFPDGTECDGWAYYRGECGPEQEPTEPAGGGGEAPTTAPAGPTGGGDGEPSATPAGEQIGTVAGWLAAVVSTPEGAQFDDYLVLQPKGAGNIGVSGATDEIEAEIQALRDKAEPGKYAHFWGTLVHDVPDYGNVQLVVTKVRYGPVETEPEPVEGWEGNLVPNPPGAQFDDYLLLAGEYPVGYGIGSLDEAVQEQLDAVRGTETIIRVWGQLRCGVPDAFGSQIEVSRVQVVK